MKRDSQIQKTNVVAIGEVGGEIGEGDKEV